MTGVGAVTALRWDRLGPSPSQAKSDGKAFDFRVKSESKGPSMAIARSSTDPNELTRKALDALGGMARFITKGDIVVIKPNIGWDRSPEQAANTNPIVVATLVRAAYEAGAKHVQVTDMSCNEPQRAFQRSGIWKLAYEAGAEIVLPEEHQFREVSMGGQVLDRWPVLRPLLDATKVINVPIAKHHSLAKFTGSMKNWYGIISGRRNRLHQDIDTSIADLASFMQPTLTVVDAVRVLMRNGPQGGNLDDARMANEVIASVDQVAADAYACTLIGQNPEQLGYLRQAQQRGLGTLDYKLLDPRQV